jgi:hypothetical protein
MSWLGKLLVVVAALAVLLGFLLVIEFGITAGRIHEGVTINKINVGWMTREEAEEALCNTVDVAARSPVEFRVEGYDDRFEFLPAEVGWRARVPRAVGNALSVGRSGGLSAIGDRIQAWTSDVRVPWRGTVDREAVSSLIDRWERQAGQLGVQIDRWQLRWKIRRSILVLPRRELFIPVQSGDYVGTSSPADTEPGAAPPVADESCVGLGSGEG